MLSRISFRALGSAVRAENHFVVRFFASTGSGDDDRGKKPRNSAMDEFFSGSEKKKGFFSNIGRDSGQGKLASSPQSSRYRERRKPRDDGNRPGPQAPPTDEDFDANDKKRKGRKAPRRKGEMMTGGGNRNRKGKKGGDRQRDNQRGGFQVGDATDAYAMDALLLNDVMRAARAGQKIDTHDMDDADAFVTSLIEESAKTSDHTTTMVLDLPKNEQTIPEPRGAAELMASLMPRKEALLGAAEGSIPHSVASSAWSEISRNHYYSEEEQERATRASSHLATSMLAYADALNEEDIDPIFDPAWRKGPVQIAEDERRAAERVTPTSTVGDQGETDWSKDAVVDEDEL